MRLLIILLSISISIVVNAQSLPLDKNGKVNFSDVYEMDSLTKLELFSRAKLFISETFTSADAVIDLEDQTSGVIVAKGWSKIEIQWAGVTVPQKLWYSIKIYCKEGKYKYEITDLYFQGFPNQYNMHPVKQPVEPVVVDGLTKPNGKPNKANVKWKEALRTECIALELALISSMNTAPGGDW